MISMLTCSSIDLIPGQVKSKTIELAVTASPVGLQPYRTKDSLACSQDNVLEWSDMSTHGLLALYKTNSAYRYSTRRTSLSSHQIVICSQKTTM